MSSDTALRQEIRHSLNDVRRWICGYSGLYSNENLTRDVLRACDEMTMQIEADPRLEEARRLVEDRCRRLARATDRFADRDPALIAASRAQAIAAIDLFQDAVFTLRKAHIPTQQLGGLLRRRSL
jgi:hypothetical protein